MLDQITALERQLLALDNEKKQISVRYLNSLKMISNLLFLGKNEYF